ncbi:tyrosine-type recombinase/integrase, partial [Citreimonas sp.]|uniref:tyrosine-type recombinase/integrase n=1 Tax=Citreimonas sp. TaxID=3036715 RepID=UPI0035C84604
MTEKKSLTETIVRNLTAPEGKRLEVPDAGCPGLKLRVYPTGRKAWLYEKRVRGGPKRKHSLGTYPLVSLKMARAAAQEIAVEANAGVDRVALNAEAKRTAEEREKATASVGRAIEHYHELHLVNLRSGSERRRVLAQALKTYLDKPVTALSRPILQKAIDEKAAGGAKIQANRIKAALSHFAKFLWERGYLSEHIGANLSKAVKEHARDRVPSIAEVRAIYSATFDMGDLWGPLFRLIILTGQRRSEIAELRWRDVNMADQCLIYGGSAVKNRQPHIVHLSAPARAEVEALQNGQGGDDFLFTTTGTTPVSGMSKAKKRLDAFLGADFERWRLHDLRTGFATAMVDAG